MENKKNKKSFSIDLPKAVATLIDGISGRLTDALKVTASG